MRSEKQSRMRSEYIRKESKKNLNNGVKTWRHNYKSYKKNKKTRIRLQ